jgi:glycosidase
MKKLILLFYLLPFLSFAQSTVERIEPPFWWVGMNNTELQIMLYGENVADAKPIINYDGITIERIVSVENNNYLFIYLNIENTTKPGEFVIYLKNNSGEIINEINYQLLPREKDAAAVKGYDNSDVMYLITPDRFANGNPLNDNIEGMPDQLNRMDKHGRHGGDLQGIIQHLDYFSDMGYTAIWLNPILENNQPESSYHGYSTTDYYRVDPRFGTNEEYRELAQKARGKNIKIIMDMIMNHCGSGHWWMKDLPSKDWINHVDNPFYTSHRRTTLRDPYASKYDIDHFADGWFVKSMPDLNQRNPLMAKYLIQNTIWWIEYLRLAGVRMDTYPYSDKNFMNDWTCAVMDEYPNFNICGEEWSLNPIILAYWQKGKINPDGYTSCLPGLLDFPLQHAFVSALVEEDTWNSGMVNLYEMLSLDFIYPAPDKHVIFPDNHDMSRIFTQLNEDIDFLKMAIIYFATMRGTPQFYYGTEILMSNTGDDSHGNIRSDFPGGWSGDEINAFTGKGLTEYQINTQQFIKKILNWRKGATAVHHGKLMHFAPQKNVYVYFRYNDAQKIMVVLNKADEQREIDLSQYRELLKNGATGKDIIAGKEIILGQTLSIGPKKGFILEVN